MGEDAGWLLDEQQRVWRDWVALTVQLPAVLHRELQADAGLSLPDFDVLVQLTDTPEERLRVCDLARQLGWERSRVSHHVTRMERRGLVRRDGCVADGRGAFVVLTGEGRAAIEQAAPGHVASVRRLLFDRLDDQEVAALGTALRKVRDGLGDQPAG